MKRLMLCEEKIRLLDAYVTATDRQFEAVKSLRFFADYAAKKWPLRGSCSLLLQC
jgi:hypothetical protein